MKRTNTLYWIFTALFAALMTMSGIPDIMLSPMAVTGMHDGLGYPVYFIRFIGIAKVLGAIAILVPGFHRLKEWAYAGLVFDLLGATYSIAASNQPATSYLFMVLPLGLAAASYILYHKRLKGMTGAASAKSNPYAPSNQASLGIQ